MRPFEELPVPWLPDDETWDSPRRLTDSEAFAEAGPGWRRSDDRIHDPEDVR